MTEQTNQDFQDRLSKLESGQTNLQTDMTANTKLTSGMQVDVEEMLGILNAVKGGIKVLGVLGNVLKWTASIIAACAAIWAALHNFGAFK